MYCARLASVFTASRIGKINKANRDKKGLIMKKEKIKFVFENIKENKGWVYKLNNKGLLSSLLLC